MAFDIYVVLMGLAYLVAVVCGFASGARKGWSLFCSVALLFSGGIIKGWIDSISLSAEYIDFPPHEYAQPSVADISFTKSAFAAVPCGADAIACYFPSRQRIYIANPCLKAFAGEAYAALLCHEMAHAQGWRGHDGEMTIETFYALSDDLEAE